MEESLKGGAVAHDDQRLPRKGLPIIRRDDMDLDEFIRVASNFNYDKGKLFKEKKMNVSYPQGFAGSVYNSLLTHISSVQSMKSNGYYTDTLCTSSYDDTELKRPSSARETAESYFSDESSNDDSQDGSDYAPMERVSQAVSVIVNDVKDQDDSDSGGNSIDSGFSTKPCSPMEEMLNNRNRDGGGKSKSRRRRKSEYVYNPLPVGRKSTRKFVPTDKKDDRYWEQRIKNNIAAKRSREARRQKEMEILSRCQALVNENDSLKELNKRLKNKIDELEQRLELYNKVVSNDNLVLVKV